MKKRIVLAGYYGFKNIGDDLLADAIVSLLQKHMHSCNITVLCGNASYMQHTLNVHCISRRNIFSLIYHLVRADMFIIGGGSILQDASGPLSFLYYFMLCITAFFCRCKLCFLYQGFGPFSSDLYTRLCGILFNISSYISVRDMQSAEFVKQHSEKNAVVSYDPVIWSCWNRSFTSSPAIAIIPRTWKENGISVNVNRKLAGIADEYIERSYAVYLIPFCSKDISDCAQINAYMKYTPELCELPENINDIVSLFSSIDEVISVRLHGSIIAVSAQKKCLCINYDPKVAAFSKIFSVPCIEPDELHAATNILCASADYDILHSCAASVENCIKNIRKIS